LGGLKLDAGSFQSWSFGKQSLEPGRHGASCHKSHGESYGTCLVKYLDMVFFNVFHVFFAISMIDYGNLFTEGYENIYP
jgi:hypothetical protein